LARWQVRPHVPTNHSKATRENRLPAGIVSYEKNSAYHASTMKHFRATWFKRSLCTSITHALRK
jgi:hypothetical protein